MLSFPAFALTCPSFWNTPPPKMQRANCLSHPRSVLGWHLLRSHLKSPQHSQFPHLPHVAFYNILHNFLIMFWEWGVGGFFWFGFIFLFGLSPSGKMEVLKGNLDQSLKLIDAQSIYVGEHLMYRTKEIIR